MSPVGVVDFVLHFVNTAGHPALFFPKVSFSLALWYSFTYERECLAAITTANTWPCVSGISKSLRDQKANTA